MKGIIWLRKCWLSYKRRKALRNIRTGMASMGIDIYQLSDEEIEAAVFSISKVIARAGMTFEELGNGIARAISQRKV